MYSNNIAGPNSAASQGACSDKSFQGVPYTARLFCVLSSILFFACSFSLAWALLLRLSSRFKLFLSAAQADCAARVNSTMHVMLVAPLLIVGIALARWSSNYEILSSPALLQAALTISSGYFIFDLYVVLVYRTPYWEVFVLHHILACYPYLVYLFSSTCPFGIYVLSCYMLVEVTNLGYNTMLWLQDYGLIQTRYYDATFWLTVALWVVFRLANPMWCLICTHKYILPNVVGSTYCLYPAAICGIFVNIFCWATFVKILAIDAYKRIAYKILPR